MSRTSAMALQRLVFLWNRLLLIINGFQYLAPFRDAVRSLVGTSVTQARSVAVSSFMVCKLEEQGISLVHRLIQRLTCLDMLLDNV